MRLRNIFEAKNLPKEGMHRLMESMNKGDSVITNSEMKHKKILMEPEDLISENMRLIEKLIDLRLSKPKEDSK